MASDKDREANADEGLLAQVCNIIIIMGVAQNLHLLCIIGIGLPNRASVWAGSCDVPSSAS